MEEGQPKEEKNKQLKQVVVKKTQIIERGEQGRIMEMKTSKKQKEKMAVSETSSIEAEVKLEETKSQKRGRGRPRKNLIVASDSTKQNQLKQAKQISSQASKAGKESLQQPKLEQKQDQALQKISKKKVKLKESDPNEKDLCQALLCIKKKLPHRSLERTIIKLYQTVEKTRKQTQKNIPDINLSIHSSQGSVHGNETIKENSVVKGSYQNQQVGCAISQAGSQQTHSSQPFQKLVLPGRKASCYHDAPASIAATSHQYFKNNPPTLQQLQTFQKNLQALPIVSKPRLDSKVTAQTKQEQSLLRNSVQQNAYFKFSESQTLKTNILSSVEEEKYQLRRKLAKIFVERGFGITKAIDADLPPIDIDRIKYRNLMGGILTVTFRKLESFIACSLGNTIKYLDRGQMKSASLMLINCRVHLEPTHCETFLKFMRIAFGLGDVVVSKSQALDLYVGVLKHLYGKSITMSELQKMALISTKRNLEAKMPILKKIAQRQRDGSKKSIFSASEANFYAEFSQQQNNNAQIWTADADRQLMNLYVQYQDLSTIKPFMQQIYSSLSLLESQEFQKRLIFLTKVGLKNITEDSKAKSYQGPALQSMSRDQIEFIACSNEATKMKRAILSYQLSKSSSVLRQSVDQINSFLRQFCQQSYSDIYYDDQPDNIKIPDDFSISLTQRSQQNDEYYDEKLQNERNRDIFAEMDDNFMESIDFQKGK